MGSRVRLNVSVMAIPGAALLVPAALRLTTGLYDSSLRAAGGIRLRTPLWGFVSFGSPPAAAFCRISVVFVGWGSARLA